ncbi:MAG: hypothetical protein KGJ84_02910 [Elusimicrobia bacterium]|nr:hypothetical protein [Elusimicrobiota bacterium]
MRFAARLLLLPFLALRASAAVLVAPAEVPRIISPSASFGPASASPLLLTPTVPALLVPPAPVLIIPAAPVLVAPAPVIVTAARPLTEAEAAPEKLPSRADLKTLAESLAPSRDATEEGDSPERRAGSLGSAFDGALSPEAAAWDEVGDRFARGPLTPGLPVVETAARSLIARLLPSLYRRVPVTAVYDRSERPVTGHTWTAETGHVVEISPVSADARGEVPNAFGGPSAARVQQKIEHLMEFAHEYFHVLFDSAVRRTENHAPHSVYSAMTEGFAVGGEQLLAERLLDLVPTLGLGPRDASDLAAVARERRAWLDTEDNHYSEGIIAWRKAYAEGGVPGMISFLSSLSAKRMAGTPRSDAAYQLALGDPALLGAYMGREDNPTRRGLDAFSKAARGEKLNEEETREASAAVERAGPEGWRRLFDRTLLADKRLKEPQAAVEGANWWDKKAEALPSVEPVFALARLSPAAGAVLSRYLAATIADRGGAVRLFERPGPNDKTNAIIAGAESLPWAEADHKAWNDGLMRWLIGAN